MKKIGLLFIFFASSAFSVGTRIWEVRDFKECKLENIMVDKDGVASLAPEIKSIWKNPEVYIWSILEKGSPRKGKTLYVGTGGGGKIYRVVVGRNKINFELLFDTKQAGIFSLAEFGNKIYAGTSPNGIIYVIDKKGEGKVFKETQENYIWSIVFDEQGTLYAATGTTGKILKITSTGVVDTFYTVKEPNIPFFARYKNYFYAGTGEKGQLFKIDLKGKGVCIYDADEKEIKSAVPLNKSIFVAATGDTSGSIYCISQDNKVEKIWGINLPIRGLQKIDGKLLVGAGNRVFRIDVGNRYAVSLLAELPTNISCMKNDWLGTSELGDIYELQRDLSSKGSIESKAHDTRGVSEWGRLEFEGEGDIEFFTRSGNTEEPDETWNDWIAISSSEKIKSPYARFIQWKAVLTAKSQFLKSVCISFLPQNNKPEILSIEFKKDKKDKKGKKNISKGTKEIVWKAKDIDKDKLVFNLYFRLTEEKIWTLLKKAFTDTSYNIDPSVFPDGKYEFKVEVSDSLTNSIDYYLKNEKVSEPYVIDNTGPTIKLGKIEGGKLKVKAVDEFSHIKSCSYVIDGGSWVHVFPVDRIFDSKEEEFNIVFEKARKIVIRVYDSSGNVSLQSKLIK